MFVIFYCPKTKSVLMHQDSLNVFHSLSLNKSIENGISFYLSKAAFKAMLKSPEGLFLFEMFFNIQKQRVIRRILKYIFKNCINENEYITKMMRYSEANIRCANIKISPTYFFLNIFGLILFAL